MASFSPRLDVLAAEQRQLWPELQPIRALGYVLYGGTAIALHLGHRRSVDFDFFSSQSLDRDKLRNSLSFLSDAVVRQDSPNTFVIVTASRVKVSFFGGLDFGRIGEPRTTANGVLRVASLVDLMATKLKVVLRRTESKDYMDIAAMVRAGTGLEVGLAAAELMLKSTFSPSESLRALVYFEGGDLELLGTADREVLVAAAAAVRALPKVALTPDLASIAQEESPPAKSSVSLQEKTPRRGPRLGP